MNIGKKIRALRTENHMTQEALAERLGVSAQAVSKWEQAMTAPDISLLGDIASVFQVTTDELLEAGRYKSAAGYGTYRERLLAVYEETGREEDFRRAESAFADVLLHGEPEVGDYMHYGYLYFQRARRDMELAGRYYEQALASGENSRDWKWFQTHQQITLLYVMQGRGDEAVERWKAWLAEEPECEMACLAVVWALVHSGRAGEALPYLEMAIKRAPEDPAVLTAYGDVLGGKNGLGRYAEAIAYWNRAQELAPEYGDVRWSRAYAYEQMGCLDQAIREYEELCRWLEERGYDTGVETREPEERLRRLRMQAAGGTTKQK